MDLLVAYFKTIPQCTPHLRMHYQDESALSLSSGPELYGRSPTEYMQLMMNRHYYLPMKYLNNEQCSEFTQALNACDELDRRNLGACIGVMLLGILGYIAFGFIGLVAGGLIGLILGRYVGKRIRQQMQPEQLLELDIYDCRVRCFIKWAMSMAVKYKYNLNVIRLITEKLLLEIKLALHYKQFGGVYQLKMKALLFKLVILLKQPIFSNARVLSLLLTREYIDILTHLQLEDGLMEQFRPYQSQLEVSVIQAVDNVLRPMVTLFKETQVEDDPICKLASDILLRPEVLAINERFPDPQMSIHYIKMLVDKMRMPIRTANIKEYAEQQNFKDLEKIGITIRCANNERPKSEVQIDVIVNAEIQIELPSEHALQLIVKLQEHPNRVLIMQVDQKSGQFGDTPQQSVYQMLDHEQLIIQHHPLYPPHYSDVTIKKFELFNQLHNESTSSWDLCIDTEMIVLHKIMKEGSDSVFIKGHCLYPQTNIKQLITAVYDVDVRRKWDKLLCGFTVVLTEHDDTDIVTYYVVPPTRLVTQREWLQRRVIRTDYPTQGCVMLLFYSIEIPTIPVSKGRIRAHTEISTMIFEQLGSTSKVSILSNNDIKGFIPKFIVNKASTSGPVDWFHSLGNACNH